MNKVVRVIRSCGGKFYERTFELPEIPWMPTVLDLRQYGSSSLKVREVVVRPYGGFSPGFKPTLIDVFVEPESEGAADSAPKYNWKEVSAESVEF